MPGTDQYERMRPAVERANNALSGGLETRWADVSQSLTHTLGGRSYRFDLATMRRPKRQ